MSRTGWRERGSMVLFVTLAAPGCYYGGARGTAVVAGEAGLRGREMR